MNSKINQQNEPANSTYKHHIKKGVSENRTLPLNPAHIILGCYCGSIVIRVESFDPGENVAMISSLQKKKINLNVMFMI
jgi:hypothetical protein